MRTRVEMFCWRSDGQMKEESNCFGLIIWIRAARGYTHLLRALSGWRDGEEGEMRKRRELVSRKDSQASILQE